MTTNAHMLWLPLLVAGLAAATDPLAVNDVCYHFCEDGSKPAVSRRDECPPGTAAWRDRSLAAYRSRFDPVALLRRADAWNERPRGDL